MKFKTYLFPALLIAGSVLFFTSCEKKNALPVQSAPLNFEEPPALAIDESFIEEIDQLVAAHKAQLTKTAGGARSSCPETILVPDDYATIQEAIDAACHENGTDIIVNAGTYDEGRVLVTKPDLHLKANGAVTLMGGFSLDGNADNTQIHKFNIVLNETAWGIAGSDFTGGEFKQNTISGSGDFNYAGITFGNVSDVNIKQNTVSNLRWGISIISGYAAATGSYGSSRNNTIQGNRVTDILRASGIHLQGDSDHNLITGNKVSNKQDIWNGGIMLHRTIFSGNPVVYYPDNNTLMNNVVTNCTESPGLLMYGSDNTLGPNNIINSNGNWGVYISANANSNNNHMFNNTVLNNQPCDINYGNATNTYSNNEADCTDGGL